LVYAFFVAIFVEKH